MPMIFRDSRPTGSKVWVVDFDEGRRWIKDGAEAVELDKANDLAGIPWPSYPSYPIYPWDLMQRIPEIPNAI